MKYFATALELESAKLAVFAKVTKNTIHNYWRTKNARKLSPFNGAAEKTLVSIEVEARVFSANKWRLFFRSARVAAEKIFQLNPYGFGNPRQRIH